ncbi:hypothetical protein DFH08DRAFT_906589 [Mycena albidolilacea]|uniref:Uncharacterized protein n=1 Tax=Mycena albidolilacea TaxID=1033008 RepID=A0AAD7E790_9AGAR|nr:hypothetical protein DFH08DRAFT_906589 [Mycena albidolilacea]
MILHAFFFLRGLFFLFILFLLDYLFFVVRPTRLDVLLDMDMDMDACVFSPPSSSSTSSLLPLPPSLPFSPSGLLVCSYIFKFQKRREEKDAAAVFCFVVLIVYSGLVSGPG